MANWIQSRKTTITVIFIQEIELNIFYKNSLLFSDFDRDNTQRRRRRRMNINPVNLDNMFDVISLSTEDDSSDELDSSDSDVEIEDDVDVVESNSSNGNSGAESDGVEEMQLDEEVGWETTSETED